MYIFAIIVLTLIVIFGIIFGAQNTTPVLVYFFNKKIQTPLISVIIVSFAIGAILAFILTIIDGIRLRAKIGAQKKEIENLEKELGTLKTTQGEEK